MALSKSFADGQILTPADVNQHLVNHVPKAGDTYDTGWGEGVPTVGTGAIRCRRVGTLASVYFDVTGLNTTANTWVDLGVIPSAARPSRTTWGAAYTATGGGHPLLTIVGVNGVLSVRHTTSISHATGTINFLVG